MLHCVTGAPPFPFQKYLSYAPSTTAPTFQQIKETLTLVLTECAKCTNKHPQKNPTENQRFSDAIHLDIPPTRCHNTNMDTCVRPSLYPYDPSILSDPDNPFAHHQVRNEPPAPPTPLPDWLSLAPTPRQQTSNPKYPRTKEELAIEQMTFEAVFEKVLDVIVEGQGVREFLRTDTRRVDYGRFLRWIREDKERLARYEEAQEIGTEAILETMDEIAAGTHSMEDIERSKLRLAQYKFKVQAWNKRRYGTDKETPTPFGSGGITINISAVDVPTTIGNVIEQKVERLE